MDVLLADTLQLQETYPFQAGEDCCTLKEVHEYRDAMDLVKDNTEGDLFSDDDLIFEVNIPITPRTPVGGLCSQELVPSALKYNEFCAAFLNETESQTTETLPESPVARRKPSTKRKRGIKKTSSYYGRLRRAEYIVDYSVKLDVDGTDLHLSVHRRRSDNQVTVRLAKYDETGPTCHSLCFDEASFWAFRRVSTRQLTGEDDGTLADAIIELTESITLFRIGTNVSISLSVGRAFQGLLLSGAEFSDFLFTLEFIRQRQIILYPDDASWCPDGSHNERLQVNEWQSIEW